MDEGSDLDSVTTWIGKAKSGDLDATKKLWIRYFEVLAEFARKKLPVHLKQMADEEDIATSALTSLMKGLKEGRFDRIRDRRDLWVTLTIIAGRKAQNLVKYETRQKRDIRLKKTDSACLLYTSPSPRDRG
jgi:DNA-binding MarR family transcriptional regulator